MSNKVTEFVSFFSRNEERWSEGRRKRMEKSNSITDVAIHHIACMCVLCPLIRYILYSHPYPACLPLPFAASSTKSCVDIYSTEHLYNTTNRAKMNRFERPSALCPARMKLTISPPLGLSYPPFLVAAPAASRGGGGEANVFIYLFLFLIFRSTVL